MCKITNPIIFVKAGVKPKSSIPAGILSEAQDWQLLVDLEKQPRFPKHIVSTNLRANILLVSEAFKTIIIMEQTVPWENCLGEAHKRKGTKYERLVTSC